MPKKTFNDIVQEYDRKKNLSDKFGKEVEKEPNSMRVKDTYDASIKRQAVNDLMDPPTIDRTEEKRKAGQYSSTSD